MKKQALALVALMLVEGSALQASPLYKNVLAKDSIQAEQKADKSENKKEAKKADAKKTEKKISEYQKLIKKGGSKQEGLFTVRHIKNKWYYEIPDEKLGKLLLAVTRFTAVPSGFQYNVGEEVNENVIYFEKRDDKTIWLRSYTHDRIADAQDKISMSVEKATIDPIIAKFNIIQDDKKGAKKHGYLIDVTAFYTEDNQVTSFSVNDRKVMKLGAQKKDITYIDTLKSFPINIEASTLRTYACEPGKTAASKVGAITLSLNTSIVELPENPMQPRLEDERVGYFVKKFTKFSDYDMLKHDAIVSRYRLEPKDEKAYLAGKLVEPKKQIVYYIDPATPKKWVPYLMAGINDWNKAFEAAGFKNAIVAKEWPNDKNMSVDDARYCVLRYLPSEISNAYGPRIVDPRSGEIIESHICWYHNVTDLLRRWYMVQCGPLDKHAQTMEFDEELMGQLIRFVSSHEVGHTLGLRHNMIASSATPVEKLRDKKWVEEHGHTSSIMDYARFNYVAQPEDGISTKGLFPRINDYDKWAIKWGYQWRPEYKDSYSEKKALRAEVTKVLASNPRLRYMGDEGRGVDPRSQTEDLGDNSMKASDYGIRNLKRVMANLEKWTAQPDGQTEYLQEMYNAVKSQYSRYTMHVQKNIAGKYAANWPAEKNLDYVSKATQKEVLSWLKRNVLTVPHWLYPERILDKVKQEPTEDINNRNSALVRYLIQPNLLNNLKKEGKYPIDEWLNDVFSIVWTPMSAKNEWQNSFTRSYQRAYIRSLKNTLIGIDDAKAGVQAGTKDSDVYLYILQHVDKLETYLNNQAKNTAAGSIAQLHYQNLLLQVKQMKASYNKIDK